MPTTEYILERESFMVAYDARNRNPMWVLEHLTKDSVQGTGTREKSGQCFWGWTDIRLGLLE